MLKDYESCLSDLTALRLERDAAKYLYTEKRAEKFLALKNGATKLSESTIEAMLHTDAELNQLREKNIALEHEVGKLYDKSIILELKLKNIQPKQ
jgi:phosphoribosyl-dephospho-CoA transferase